MYGGEASRYTIMLSFLTAGISRCNGSCLKPAGFGRGKGCARGD